MHLPVQNVLESHSLSHSFPKGIFAPPRYIFCSNLVNVHGFVGKLLSRQGVTDRWANGQTYTDRLTNAADDNTPMASKAMG